LINMTTEPVIEIPPGYQRAIRFGADEVIEEA
jgi:hypothetical protein